MDIFVSALELDELHIIFCYDNIMITKEGS
jgi:hypothetical protein